MGSPINLGHVSEHQYDDKSDSDICNDIGIMYDVIGRDDLNGLSREELMLIDAHLGEVCNVLEQARKKK